MKKYFHWLIEVKSQSKTLMAAICDFENGLRGIDKVIISGTMNWNEIKTQADADSFMETYSNFHDGCIREAHLWTGHWLSSDRSMSVDAGLDNQIRILIQVSWPKASAIELWFEEITRFNLVPAPENYDSIIFGSALLLRDGIIYWSPEDNRELPGTISDLSELGDDYKWITARKLRWREVDWLGQELRYGAKD